MRSLMTRLKNDFGYKLDESALAQINATPPAPPPGGPAAFPAPAAPGAPAPVRQ